MKLNSYRIWILANSKALLHNHDFRRKTLKIRFHGLFCALCVSFTRFWRHYGSLSRHLMALKLQHYTKFLFVRDPFVRLISAFRNKFGRCVSISGWVDREWVCDRVSVCVCVCVPWVEGKAEECASLLIKQQSFHSWIIQACVSVCVSRPNQDFYKQFGSVMLRRYGNVSGSLPETAAEAFAAGIKPTFQQFITYLLDPETERENIFNEHWRQVLVSHSYMHTSSVRLHLIQFDIVL